MIRLAPLAIALCVATAGCDDNGVTSPSTAPVVLSTILLPVNEVPPVAGPEAGGSGAFQVTFNVTRDSSNAVTAATATMYFQVAGFPAETVVRAAHIHSAVAGVNGAIVVDSGILTASPLPLQNGRLEFSSGPITVTPSMAQAIIDNPAAFYFNVHSPANPGGFARGQLRRVQ
jgi:hypothetical protein